MVVRERTEIKTLPAPLLRGEMASLCVAELHLTRFGNGCDGDAFAAMHGGSGDTVVAMTLCPAELHLTRLGRHTGQALKAVIDRTVTVELADTTVVKAEATVTDTLTMREERKERKGRPPAGTIALALAVIVGAIAAFGIDRAIDRLFG